MFERICGPRFRPLWFGQVLSVLIALTGIFSSELAVRGVSIPATQNALNYVLLTGYLLRRPGDWGKLRERLPYYALLAVFDVEVSGRRGREEGAMGHIVGFPLRGREALVLRSAGTPRRLRSREASGSLELNGGFATGELSRGAGVSLDVVHVCDVAGLLHHSLCDAAVDVDPKGEVQSDAPVGGWHLPLRARPDDCQRSAHPRTRFSVPGCVEGRPLQPGWCVPVRRDERYRRVPREEARKAARAARVAGRLWGLAQPAAGGRSGGLPVVKRAVDARCGDVLPGLRGDHVHAVQSGVLLPWHGRLGAVQPVPPHLGRVRGSLHALRLAQRRDAAVLRGVRRDVYRALHLPLRAASGPPRVARR
eukprot:scaffold1620_cov233-Pinguiococcus_pyrenoidosus.AAC.19